MITLDKNKDNSEILEYGNVIYRFGSNLKCGWLSKQIDYIGTMAPTSPDNIEIFNLIYPRFA